MIRDGVTTFVECGGGDVLSGLLRRIDKSAKSARVYDAATLATTLEEIHG
jgi:[acyl-carrier-protein] S-malonyltransferase